MKKKKLSQKQVQSLRERSASPGRLIQPKNDKKLETNQTIDYNAWNKFIKAVDFFSEYTEEFSTKALNISAGENKVSEKIGLLIELGDTYNFNLRFKNLPTFIFNDIDEKYLNRVSTSKGPHVFASTTPMWKLLEGQEASNQELLKSGIFGGGDG